jgi:hypothetical protein
MLCSKRLVASVVVGAVSAEAFLAPAMPSARFALISVSPEACLKENPCMGACHVLGVGCVAANRQPSRGDSVGRGSWAA